MFVLTNDSNRETLYPRYETYRPDGIWILLGEVIMAKIKYFNGDEELGNAFSVSKDRFLQAGGVPSKTNRDGCNFWMAYPLVGGPVPVTRKIEYKSNPSKHKCSAKCLSAKGHVCECECGGKNHGLLA